MSQVSRPAPGSTSTSLIERAQRADATALTRLVQLYGPVAYGWARHHGLQPHDAADVMQDVMQAAVTSMGQFRKERWQDSFRGWLYTITRHRICDFHRARQGSPLAVGGSDHLSRLEQIAAAPPDIASVAGTTEVHGLRRRALELASGDFPSRTWTAFWRTVIEGDAPADVAADLQITVWAVYKARSRILQRLRREFAELIPGLEAPGTDARRLADDGAST